MKQFVGGFVVASVLWIGIFYAQTSGLITVLGHRGIEKIDEPSAETDSDSKAIKRKTDKRRGKKKRDKPRAKASMPANHDETEGVAGDALGTQSAQNMDMGVAGGTEQLSTAQIESGIDGVFNGIQRCLVLVPSGVPALGKVEFGMRIAPSGKVVGVRLKGPNTLIMGEVGACFSRIMKSIKYPSFDGPEMIVRYPITFE